MMLVATLDRAGFYVAALTITWITLAVELNRVKNYMFLCRDILPDQKRGNEFASRMIYIEPVVKRQAVV